MQLTWMQIAIVAAGVLLLSGGSLNLASIKALVAKLLGGLSLGGGAASETDRTLERVKLHQQLVALCKDDCPEALRLLKELFPHLQADHEHEGGK